MSNTESPTWPYVEEFAKTIEYKLSLNRRKGDREGWVNENAGYLLTRLCEEFEELADAIESGIVEDIELEAADCGAFSMMIYDACRNGPNFFS